jgi:hypothetical protein
MTVLGTKPVHRISEYAYTRKITKVRLTNEEKKKIKTNCTHCGLEVQISSLKNIKYPRDARTYNWPTIKQIWCVSQYKKKKNNQKYL